MLKKSKKKERIENKILATKIAIKIVWQSKLVKDKKLSS